MKYFFYGFFLLCNCCFAMETPAWIRIQENYKKKQGKPLSINTNFRIVKVSMPALVPVSERSKNSKVKVEPFLSKRTGESLFIQKSKFKPAEEMHHSNLPVFAGTPSPSVPEKRGPVSGHYPVSVYPPDVWRRKFFRELEEKLIVEAPKIFFAMVKIKD